MKKDVNFLPTHVSQKIIAVGLNYKDHAKELNMPIPENPIIFLKPSTSLIGHNEPIIYPKMSKQVDYEAELAIVIKQKAHKVSVENASDYILGYTCANDVTARDLQKIDGQWTRSKSFDTFCPIGPHIETELNTDNLSIQSFLNGELKQNSNTSNLIFKPNYLIHFISCIMTLYPGDIILTGTPAGIGPMQVGDEVEVRIEGVGSLRNGVNH
ncbi:fumarylacetoacetate hydrolase family protein [bacterium]